MSEISQSELKATMRYDAETGKFYWIKQNSKHQVGDEAGSFDPSKGYVRIFVKGRRYYRSRLAYLYTFGVLPKEIDHINRKRDDDRIANLRSCERWQNLRNSTYDRGSGITVLQVKAKQRNVQKYRARLSIKGTRKHLGVFDTYEEAESVYLAALNAVDELDAFRPCLK